MREVADIRVHGTTGEPPRLRFDRDEAAALHALNGRPPFGAVRELLRRAQDDCATTSKPGGQFYLSPGGQFRGSVLI